jgi:hypothetical protein
MGPAMVRRYSVADLTTAAVQQALEEYLAALREGDTRGWSPSSGGMETRSWTATSRQRT